MEMDFSTINIAALMRRPVAKLAPTYNIGRQMGAGCFGDPPGYPTYFLQHVYTSHGNSPNKGAQTVIVYKGVPYVVQHSDDYKRQDSSERFAKLMRSLWAPLPEDHERTRHWMASVYKHQGEGYRLAGMVGQYGRGSETLFIQAGKLAHWQEHRLFGHARFAKLHARCDSKSWASRIITRYLMRHVKPENLVAVHIIRRYYPEHQPMPELGVALAAAHGNVPTWWETEATAPTAETCKPRSMGPHPINGSWCQACGWQVPNESAA